MSRITLPSGPQRVCLYNHHEVTAWKGSKVWHDRNREAFFLLSGLESSPWGAARAIVLGDNGQIPGVLRCLFEIAKEDGGKSRSGTEPTRPKPQRLSLSR